MSTLEQIIVWAILVIAIGFLINHFSRRSDSEKELLIKLHDKWCGPNGMYLNLNRPRKDDLAHMIEVTNGPTTRRWCVYSTNSAEAMDLCPDIEEDSVVNILIEPMDLVFTYFIVDSVDNSTDQFIQLKNGLVAQTCSISHRKWSNDANRRNQRDEVHRPRDGKREAIEPNDPFDRSTFPRPSPEAEEDCD